MKKKSKNCDTINYLIDQTNLGAPSRMASTMKLGAR